MLISGPDAHCVPGVDGMLDQFAIVKAPRITCPGEQHFDGRRVEIDGAENLIAPDIELRMRRRPQQWRGLDHILGSDTSCGGFPSGPSRKCRG